MIKRNEVRFGHEKHTAAWKQEASGVLFRQRVHCFVTKRGKLGISQMMPENIHWRRNHFGSHARKATYDYFSGTPHISSLFIGSTQ